MGATQAFSCMSVYCQPRRLRGSNVLHAVNEEAGRQTSSYGVAPSNRKADTGRRDEGRETDMCFARRESRKRLQQEKDRLGELLEEGGAGREEAGMGAGEGGSTEANDGNDTERHDQDIRRKRRQGCRREG